MFFIIKKSKIVVDVFTDNQNAYSLFPISYANENLPDWWKKIDKKSEHNNIRNCIGIINYYNSNSLVLQMWSDLTLSYNKENFNYRFADRQSILLFHEQEMRGNVYAKDFHNFKLHSPWLFKEKTGVKFYFSKIFYNFQDPDTISMPPGIVDYKYQHATEINFLVRKPRYDDTINLKLYSGQPLVQIFPLSERKVKFKVHLVDKKEMSSMEMLSVCHKNRYQRVKKIIDDKENKKCPFGFGNKK